MLATQLLRNIPLLLVSLSCIGTASGEELKISNASDLIAFSRNVDSGESYSGTTVFLSSDIDFTEELSQEFEPIGKKDGDLNFLGVFDGQGHVIRNLRMKSALFDVGLFGCSGGSTIKNVVIDASCSFENTFNGTTSNSIPMVGGLIGRFHGSGGPGSLENNVNMASVTFRGSTGGSVYIGGIAGAFFSTVGSISVKNCANYGPVTYSGNGQKASIGGIVGNSDLIYTTSSIHVENCLNYGAITHSGTLSNTLYAGGISGAITGCAFENCVNVGAIAIEKEAGSIGSVVGILSSSSISHCYWDGNNTFGVYGEIATSTVAESPSFDEGTFRLNEAVTVGKYKGDSLLSALNAYSDSHESDFLSHWALNRGENAVSFTVNGNKMLALNSRVILLPDLGNRGLWMFDGWYTDSACTVPLTHFEIGGAMDLYGKFFENRNNYTITFDTRGGTPIEPITAQYLSKVNLPRNTKRDGCTFDHWEDERGQRVDGRFTVPARNTTFYAVWECFIIQSVADFAEFAANVNRGLGYSGTTIVLDSDLDFAGERSRVFEPMGNSTKTPFRGIFEGQGHIISNLRVALPSEYVGMFGYSDGSTVRNLVIDDSCSFESTVSSGGSFVGGVIGQCYAVSRACTVANVVNMGSVTFSGNTGESLSSIGGIAGCFESSRASKLDLKNCANYGAVTHSGASYEEHIGGIVGKAAGPSSSKMGIQNCANYGAITYAHAAPALSYLGGIVGDASYCAVENCVSAGAIALGTGAQGGVVGSVVGYLSFSSRLSNCYWAEGNSFGAYGAIESVSAVAADNSFFDERTFKLNAPVSAGGNYKGDSLIAALNALSDYRFSESYSGWVLNKGGNDASFIVSGRKTLVLSSKVILFPSYANEGNTLFYGWYTDAECKSLFTRSEIDAPTDFYGKFQVAADSFTVSFETREGAPAAEPITAPYSTVVPLPKSIRGTTRYDVAFWETKSGYQVEWNFAVPPYNITLYPSTFVSRIKSPKELIELANTVNAGTTYSEATVYLDADIEFTDELSRLFTPVGASEDKHFKGVFDGQGHTIRNLRVSSSMKYTGLFGYSSGMTVRNVVIDKSCSFVSSGNSSEVYVGGIIGRCYPSGKPCVIENNVNMASIAFNGNAEGNGPYIGGIVGDVRPTKENGEVSLKNCANYGPITLSGVANEVRAGGIAGECNGLSASAVMRIQNCLNYGTITYKFDIATSYIGGIAGDVAYVEVKNCVSAGSIEPGMQSGYAGSIVGSGYSSDAFHTVWTANLGYSPYGYGFLGTDSESTQVELNLDVVNMLRSYAASESWSKWVLNMNNAAVTFKVDAKSGFVVKSQVMILPDLVDSSEQTFHGWYKDEKLTEEFTEAEVNSDITLYGKVLVSFYVVTFDANGAEKFPWEEITVKPNEKYGYLLEPTRAGYTFLGWFTDDGKLVTRDTVVTIEEDHTLHAHWSANKYTVTLDVNGGDELAVKEITVIFDEKYGTLPTPNRNGYTFRGWFSEDGVPIVNGTLVNVARNHTIHAEWAEITSEKVEIIFTSNTMTRKDVEDFVKGYTNARFDIIKLEAHGAEGLRVVVKFAELKDAVAFVDAVRASSSAKGVVQKIGYAPTESFSSALYPTFLTLISILAVMA